jgi:hypothetical protein
MKYHDMKLTLKYITSNITFICIPHSPSGQTQASRQRSWADTSDNPHCLHHCPVPTLKQNTVLRFQVTIKESCVSDICFKLWTEKNNKYNHQDSDWSSNYLDKFISITNEKKKLSLWWISQQEGNMIILIVFTDY